MLYVNKKSNNELSKLIDNTDLLNIYNIKKISFESNSKITLGYVHTNFNNLARKLHTFLHLSLIWKNRDFTLNFKMKAYNMFGTRLQAKNYSSFMIYEKLRMNFPKRLVVKLFGNFFGVNILHRLVLLTFRIKHLLEPGLLKDLDCLLVMHGGRISFEQDYVIWLARSYCVKTISIQENWDNLSSKTMLYQHPDFFATWGKQSTQHLKRIHDFQGTTYEIGSRRLNTFYDRRKTLLEQDKNLEVSLNKDDFTKIILLVGSGDGLHDFLIAQECLRLIDLHAKELRSEFSIIYRPHPYSSNLEENIQKFKTLNGVSVDKPALHERDNYRLNLILNSSVVISLYSTMIIESCILNKPCIIPSFIENNWTFKTSDFLDKAEHYSGVSSLDGVFNPESYEEFMGVLKRIDSNDYYPVNDASLIEWFCADVDSIKSLCDLIESSLV